MADILIEAGQDAPAGKYNAAMRKGSYSLTQPTIATKRSKDAERNGANKSKRNNQVPTVEDSGTSDIIAGKK